MSVDHDRINAARSLLRRASALLDEWAERYGRIPTDVLPPGGHVRLQEDIAEFLKPPMIPAASINAVDVRDTTFDRPLPVYALGAKVIGHVPETPVGRTPERPGDLVPLANGGSVDMGARWTLPR